MSSFMNSRSIKSRWEVLKMQNEKLAKAAAEVGRELMDDTSRHILEMCMNAIKWYMEEGKYIPTDSLERILIYLKMAAESVEWILEEREKDKEDILELFK